MTLIGGDKGDKSENWGTQVPLKPPMICAPAEQYGGSGRKIGTPP